MSAMGERRWIQAVATLLPEHRRLLVLQDISELRARGRPP